MRNLLHSNYRRLFRNPMFYFGIIFFLVITEYWSLGAWGQQMETGVYKYYEDGIAKQQLIKGSFYSFTNFFNMYYVRELIHNTINYSIAIFTALFLGSDFKGGTIRNKIYSGNSKISIFIANLITCCSVTAFMYLVPVATFVIAYNSFPVYGIEPYIKTLIIEFISTLLSFMELTTLFVVISHVCASRVVSIIANIVTTYALWMGGLYFADPYIGYKVINTAYGSYENEMYKGPFVAHLYKMITYILPTTKQTLWTFQSYDTYVSDFSIGLDFSNPSYQIGITVASVGVILLLTVVGAAIIRRRNIK